MHPILNGQKIILRPLKMGDVNENYLSWLKDEDVLEGLATSGYSLAKLSQYVESRISKRDVAFYAICDKPSGKHIGNVKLDYHDVKANVSELGLMIGDKSFWGKGVGFEACRLLLNYGFNQMNIRKIYLAVYESNPHAKKLYENLGFILEGTLRKQVEVGGKFVDKYLMGIFKEELK